MGIYFASVVTLFAAIFLPMFIAHTLRGIRRDREDTALAVGMIAFAVLGTLLFVPLFWVMALNLPN